MNDKTPVAESEPEDWRAWRNAQRRELIQRRRALETDDLKQRSDAVDRSLVAVYAADAQAAASQRLR